MGGYSKSLKGRGMEKPDGVAPFASAIEEAPVGPERDYPAMQKGMAAFAAIPAFSLY